MAGKRSIRKAIDSKKKGNTQYLGKDVEDRSRPAKDRQYRFRDNRKLDPDDQRREEFKHKLMDGVERSKVLQEYRKSEDEVRSLFSVLEKHY